MKTPRWKWLALWVSFSAAAQGPSGQPGAHFMRLFDPKTVVTVDGEVTRVQRVEHKMMNMMAVEATLKTADASFNVHLGPAWFIENQELKLEVGDRVTLTGSRVSVRGEPTLITAEVKRGDDTLKLREADGTPVWVAWRRKPGPR
ncbi:MAG: DNA-binding protein [Archangiaceae bacterium]|nr:DNA-binding protein [Archangiaceae bacterium]